MQFSKEDVAQFTIVLIYSLTKCVLEDGFKDSCSENFAVFLERYPRR